MPATISDQEVYEIKKIIELLVIEIEKSKDYETKQSLLNFRFGFLQNSILHFAAKFGDIIQTEKILKIANSEIAGTNIASVNSVDTSSYINIKNKIFFTPLHFAAKNGHLAEVQTLLRAGADKNPQTSDEYRKWAPLHYAVRNGDFAIVKTLIQAGADKDLKTLFGVTPLIIAAEFGHLEILKFLLASGANKDLQTIDENQKMTALHYAVIADHQEVLLTLLKAGADQKKETNAGLNILELAAKANHGKISAILLSWGIDKWDSALKIARINNSTDVISQIKNYQKARDNFFNLKWLENLSENLPGKIGEFNCNNLHEMKINLPQEVFFNAYGIVNLKRNRGFFKKTTQTLARFLTDNNWKSEGRLPAIVNLSLAISALETLVEKNMQTCRQVS
jgi:ankyrin repeat protein